MSYQYLTYYLYFHETELVCKNCQKEEVLIKKDCTVKKKKIQHYPIEQQYKRIYIVWNRSKHSCINWMESLFHTRGHVTTSELHTSTYLNVISWVIVNSLKKKAILKAGNQQSNYMKERLSYGQYMWKRCKNNNKEKLKNCLSFFWEMYYIISYWKYSKLV